MSAPTLQQPVQPGTPRPPSYSQDAAYLLAQANKAARIAQHLRGMSSVAVLDEQHHKAPGRAHHDAMVLGSYVEDIQLPPGLMA